MYVCLFVLSLLCLHRTGRNSSNVPLPFWKIVLQEIARMPTKTHILSEFELYFQYARRVHPDSVVHRPLYWTNGPCNGMLYSSRPQVLPDGKPRLVTNSRNTHRYCGTGECESGPSTTSHVCRVHTECFHQQMFMDSLIGYDFVGYHSYAKRRYSEMRTGLCVSPSAYLFTLHFFFAQRTSKRGVQMWLL
jgi:hypothetical protein